MLHSQIGPQVINYIEKVKFLIQYYVALFKATLLFRAGIH